MPSGELTPQERRLIEKHLKFYQELASGARTPTTPEQVDFVAVCEGRKVAETPHELAYIKYRRSLQPFPPRDPDDAPEWCSRKGHKRMRAGLYGDMMKRHRDD